MTTTLRTTFTAVAAVGFGLATLGHVWLLLAYADYSLLWPMLKRWEYFWAAAITLLALAVIAVARATGRHWMIATGATGGLGFALGMALHRVGEVLWWPELKWGSQYDYSDWLLSLESPDIWPGVVDHLQVGGLLSSLAILLGFFVRLAPARLGRSSDPRSNPA